MSEDADLPKALVKRLVKEKLTAVEVAAGGGADRKALQLNKARLFAAPSMCLWIRFMLSGMHKCWSLRRCIVLHPARSSA